MLPDALSKKNIDYMEMYDIFPYFNNYLTFDEKIFCDFNFRKSKNTYIGLNIQVRNAMQPRISFGSIVFIDMNLRY